MYWIAFSPRDAAPRTVVYVADTAVVRHDSETISFERVFELDYAARRLILVPNVGFATAEWQKESVT